LPGQIIVDESRIIQGDISEIYEKCSQWLFSKAATIMRAQKPTHILATHQGPSPSDNYVDWPKIIELELKKEENEVHIHITLSDPGTNPQIVGIENRQIYWSTLVEELWAHLGIEIERTERQRLIRPEFFAIEAKKKRNSALGGLFVFAIGLFVLFFPPFGAPMHNSGLIALAAGFIYVFIQFYRLRSSRKRSRELYPEGSQLPGQNVWILLIALLILMPVSLGILYYGNFGVSTINEMDTFSGFGFSMEYPSGIGFSFENLGDGSEATNTQGMISGEIHRGINQIELVMVLWTRELYIDMEGMKESLEWDFDLLEAIESSTTGSYLLYFREIETTVEDKKIYGVGGTWYCDEQQRMYWMMYFNTQDIAYDKFFSILESFVYNPLTESS